MFSSEIPPKIIIQSYKHNGKLHRVWETNFLLKETKTILIGANDKTKVTESNGKVWTAKEPAIFYFHSEFWFNVIGLIKEDGIHYYCNMSSPFVYNKGTLKYIDYDLDVKVYPDMTYTILDEDEYEENKEQMNYPIELDSILKTNINYLLNWIRLRRGPFSPAFVNRWYQRYVTFR